MGFPTPFTVDSSRQTSPGLKFASIRDHGIAYPVFHQNGLGFDGLPHRLPALPFFCFQSRPIPSSFRRSLMARPFHSSTYFRLTAVLFLALLAALLIVERPVKLEKRITERLATQGKAAPTHWLVPVWLWRGLAVNTGLAALLVALTPLAARPLRVVNESRSTPRDEPLTRREKLIIGAAVLLLAASTAPRLGHSLWGDEEYVMKSYIAPILEQQDEGAWTFTKRPWHLTFWDYARPTNHIGFTVPARLCHDLFFRAGEDERAPWFSETLMRLPSFLAGLAAILTLVWCCRVWGWRSGVAWIALGYAGHAWLVRFGCDGRGYGIVVMLLPLLLGGLGRATQTGQWRWWLAFALAQFYLIWTYPGAVHFPAAMNVTALWLIWRQPAAQRPAQAGRWLSASLLSAMLVIGLMAPCLPPFLAFLKHNQLEGRLDLPWFQDAAAYLFCGAPWRAWDSANPLCTHLSANAPLAAAWIGLGAGLAVLGAWQLAHDPGRRPLLAFLLGGPLLLLAHIVLGGTRPYHWYLIPTLPCLFLLWAAAWNRFGACRANQRALGIAALLILAGVHVLGLPTARLLTRFPIEACRESVALTRTITNPRHPGYGSDTLTASPGMTTEAYDPAVIRFDTAEELRVLIDRARAEKKPLYLNFGFRPFLQSAQPEIFTLIDNPALFEPVQTLPGQFFTATREVHRLRE